MSHRGCHWGQWGHRDPLGVPLRSVGSEGPPGGAVGVSGVRLTPTCPPGSSCQVCPPGWRLYGGSCYRVGSGAVGWAQAEGRCRDSGAQLVVINDAQEQVGAMGRYGALWGAMGPWGALRGAMGRYKVLWGTIGHHWVLWGAMGHYRTPLVSMGCYAAQLCAMGRYGALWGSVGHYRTPLVSMGRCGAL